jgi:hypothetical protein
MAQPGYSIKKFQNEIDKGQLLENIAGIEEKGHQHCKMLWIDSI